MVLNHSHAHINTASQHVCFMCSSANLSCLWEMDEAAFALLKVSTAVCGREALEAVLLHL